MAVEERPQGFGNVADQVDVAHLSGGDQRGGHGPIFGTYLVPGEEGIVPVMQSLPREEPLSLTFEHRVVTGGEAARFLAAAIADLESAAS